MFSFKYRWLFDILVLSLVIHFGVNGLMVVIDSRLMAAPVVSESGVALSRGSAVRVRPLEDYGVISERNLFGGVSKDSGVPVAEEVVLEEIPLAVQALGLRLVGTVVSGGVVPSVAIIEERGTGKQEFYQEGDRVKEALVKRILRHNVVINTGGRDEMLTMEPEDSSGRAAPVGRPGVRPRSPAARAIQLERQELESSLANLDELMQQVRIRPYMEGRRPAGFLLSNIKPGSIFARMGLRNGDVVKGLNDQAITNPEQAVELYESLLEGGEVALEIKRGRRRQQLHYEIQ